MHEWAESGATQITPRMRPIRYWRPDEIVALSLVQSTRNIQKQMPHGAQLVRPLLKRPIAPPRAACLPNVIWSVHWKSTTKKKMEEQNPLVIAAGSNPSSFPYLAQTKWVVRCGWAATEQRLLPAAPLSWKPNPFVTPLVPRRSG
jgi:hypothetical protein